jgi:hypothetical protein
VLKRDPVEESIEICVSIGSFCEFETDGRPAIRAYQHNRVLV